MASKVIDVDDPFPDWTLGGQLNCKLAEDCLNQL